MPDDKTNTGAPDRQRIDLAEDYEVRYWASKFGVTAESLKQAVGEAGTWADDVQAHLQRA
ncbi:MAG: DUF3606 domain-containing protein [Ideonella sp.]